MGFASTHQSISSVILDKCDIKVVMEFLKGKIVPIRRCTECPNRCFREMRGIEQLKTALKIHHSNLASGSH